MCGRLTTFIFPPTGSPSENCNSNIHVFQQQLLLARFYLAFVRRRKHKFEGGGAKRKS